MKMLLKARGISGAGWSSDIVLNASLYQFGGDRGVDTFSINSHQQERSHPPH